MIAEIAVYVIPIVTDPRIAKPNGEGHGISNLATFTEIVICPLWNIADSRNAETARVLIAAAAEFLQCIIVRPICILQQATQGHRVRMNVPTIVRTVLTSDFWWFLKGRPQLWL